MSGTSPEKDSSPKQKPDETQSKTTRVQATHTPKSKDESPDQNQQSQCRLSRPQQSESKRKRNHTSQSSEEPRITSPDAVVYEPNQKRCFFVLDSAAPFEQKSEWMEEKFTYSQSQHQKNTIQTGHASANANGSSQPGGSNPVPGNPPSWLGRRVKRFLCLRS